MVTHTDDSNGEVAHRIELRMLATSVRSIAELARLTDMNRPTLSQKFNGLRKWQIDDLRQIAVVLNTTIAYLLGDTEDPNPASADDETISVPVAELKRRLKFLNLEERSIFSGESSVTGVITIEVRRLLLEELALANNVPTKYLTEFNDEPEADRVEAQIEFIRAVEAAGVTRIATRSLGAMSAADYRALTRVIASR
ncbi:MAG TPA: helix-turn-helix transcriptional regulator [Candidatus Lumbricidophila sp.]|nr:helix-turn-helix transcriptional regulator [Candidatus Lumbricidophila sp.]